MRKKMFFISHLIMKALSSYSINSYSYHSYSECDFVYKKNTVSTTTIQTGFVFYFAIIHDSKQILNGRQRTELRHNERENRMAQRSGGPRWPLSSAQGHVQQGNARPNQM